MKTNFCFKILAIGIILSVTPRAQSVLSKESPLSYEKAREAAEAYAEQLWENVQVGNGITFVNPENSPIIYMFCFFCGQAKFPSETMIKDQVTSARAYRIEGENIFKQWL